ncbi:radical SAM family heme chaperone HemW [Psychrobacter sp. 1U2]|uniref:radical SAM family heme chaperone HemW n=1 Tax=Psychrobacter sp. 1U2 TaxID=3453577 RepID=UPI003F48A029
MPAFEMDTFLTDKLQRLQTANSTKKNSVEVTTIPLALYIHIPWCVKKCPYCDFNSHELPVASPLSMSETYDDYVDALLADGLLQQPLAQGRKLSSIFIGGGTPSLLPIPQYQRLFEGLRHYFDFADDIEITMEANPGTLEHAPFAEYLAVGINRLSIGVQSFNAEKLNTLGRIHDPQQAVTAIKAAREAGFRRLNVDLMHGLPQQSLVEALHDIQLAHDTGATHISWYQLTIEPNTVFYRDQPILPDEDNLADIEEAGTALLQSLGYSNYEVSAWAGRLDTPCRHNLNYWQFGDYLAIGAGAHGKVSIDLHTDEDNIQKKMSAFLSSIDNSSLELEENLTPIYRYSKSRLPKDYLNYKNKLNDNISNNNQNNTVATPAPKMVGWSAIASDELVSEFMLNALRLHDGVTWQLFEARTGMRYEDVADAVEGLVVKGLLSESTEKLQTTALGQRYLNQILRAFL